MNEGRNNFVCGVTGCGKTYLVKRLIKDDTRLVIYDSKRGEYGDQGICFDGRQPDGYTQFVKYWERHHQDRFRLVYMPDDIYSLDEFDAVCRLAYALGQLTLVAEEIMTYTTSHALKRADKGQGFKRLLTAGRSKNISTYLLTQRPFSIPREVTSQARTAYLFRTHEQSDINYIKQTFGADAAEQVASLTGYDHIEWNNDGTIQRSNADDGYEQEGSDGPGGVGSVPDVGGSGDLGSDKDGPDLQEIDGDAPANPRDPDGDGQEQ